MYFKFKNAKIYYEKYGNNNKTILILPGWGNTRNTFNNIINNLKQEHTVYIIDYPNFGNSPTPKKELTIYNYTELIQNFIKKNNLKIHTIIAHSFGGRITSILLTKYNIEIKKLILIDVAGIKRKKSFIKYIKEKIYKLLKLTTKILPKNLKDKYQKQLLLSFASKDYQTLPKTMYKTFQNIIKEDLRKYYKNIQTETLIIWGENDIDTPLKDAKYLHKNIKNSGLIIYKGATHYSYLNYPYKTILIIKSFIKEKEIH